MSRCATGCRGDEGSALLEFSYLAVLLMVPLVYVLLSVFAVQRAAFGTTEAARQAGRAYVRAGDPVTGQERAARASALALADQGLPPGPLDVDDPTGSAPGGRVTVTVRATVRLPLVGALLPARLEPTVPVSATHTEVIDRFRAPG